MAFIDPLVDGRTRIKLCGMTREEDVDAAVAAGVDAVGFVFYAASPRAVSIAQAVRLAARLPATVAAIGLFVDAPRDAVDEVLDAVPLSLVQFHGDESPEDCVGFRVPHVKAARVAPGCDLLRFATRHDAASALLLDAHTPLYGGAGKTFDWSLVPAELLDTASAPAAARRVVLSGGLNAANVADAIRRVRPHAVDAASGVEVAKGVKSPAAIRAFVAAVRSADRRVSESWA